MKGVRRAMARAARPGAGLSVLLAVLLVGGGLSPDGPRAASSQPPPDTTASEPDSIPLYELDEGVETRASELTLREIIQRCVEGEKTKLAGHHDMTFNAMVRTILTWEGKKREILDQVYLVYEDDKGVSKRVRLTEDKTIEDYKKGAWVPREDEDDDEEEVQINVEASDRGADMSRLPFFLKDQEEYDFELLERHLEGDHVIFKIAFHPRSKFKPLPSGTVYVDTHAYRIVHEEFTFEENPAPMFLKDVKSISRQWMELPGGQWVVSKVLGEVELRGGFTGLIPGRVQFALLLNDYRFDQGYDSHRFGPYEAR